MYMVKWTSSHDIGALTLSRSIVCYSEIIYFACFNFVCNQKWISIHSDNSHCQICKLFLLVIEITQHRLNILIFYEILVFFYMNVIA